MTATGTDWFSCRYVRIAGPAHVVSSGPIPDPTLGCKPHRSDVVSAADAVTCSVLSSGARFFGDHDDPLSDGWWASVLPDPVPEFSDIEQLAAGKDYRSAAPNPGLPTRVTSRTT
jgi:hypothetical protein